MINIEIDFLEFLEQNKSDSELKLEDIKHLRM